MRSASEPAVNNACLCLRPRAGAPTGDQYQHAQRGEARKVEPLKDKFKKDINKIRGCVSNLWVKGKVLEDGTMKYEHDADSYVTKGTAKVIIDIVNGELQNEVAQLNLESFKLLGIRELLTMQRQVGFASLIDRIVRIANDN